MLDIIKAHAVKNLCYIAAQKMEPKGIVVHSTGANNPNLKRYVDAENEVGINKYGNHWNKAKPGGRKVCVHAFIGYDKYKQLRVAEILPLNICCWGVGKGKKGSYNTNPAYIQFEICEDGLVDRSYYEKAFACAAEYCTELCETYNIDVENIVSHREACKRGYGSNHGDPEHWMKKFGETMTDFREKVKKTLSKKYSTVLEQEEKQNTFFPYKVKITVQCLNIREEAGTDKVKVGSITDKGVYTIVEEKDGCGASKWGRLKSGKGWISLDYTKRL